VASNETAVTVIDARDVQEEIVAVDHDQHQEQDHCLKEEDIHLVKCVLFGMAVRPFIDFTVY
jgi:hypothetical protein